MPPPAIRMFRTWDGALPMATRFTSHPVASVNFDQLPSGSETPTSAKLMVPLDAACADCISGQAAEPAETAVIVAEDGFGHRDGAGEGLGAARARRVARRQRCFQFCASSNDCAAR